MRIACSGLLAQRSRPNQLTNSLTLVSSVPLDPRRTEHVDYPQFHTPVNPIFDNARSRPTRFCCLRTHRQKPNSKANCLCEQTLYRATSVTELDSDTPTGTYSTAKRENVPKPALVRSSRCRPGRLKCWRAHCPQLKRHVPASPRLQQPRDPCTSSGTCAARWRRTKDRDAGSASP